MTNQEAFTTVVQHLRTQGVPSSMPRVESVPRCLYRHPDGIRRCAVGVLIPDDEYSPEMEDQTLFGVAKTHSLRHLDINLLKALQLAHDTSHPDSQSWLSFMETCYIDIALRFHLQVPAHPMETTHERTTIHEGTLQRA